MFGVFKKQKEKKADANTTEPATLTAAVSAPASTLFLSFSTKERVLFAKRLSFLMKAGVGVLESITIVRNQTKSKRKQKLFDTVAADVAAGAYLSKSLARYEPQFGSFTINMIKVGESAGVLSENLTYLAEELGKKQALERKVKGALVYPLFISFATIGVTSMLVVFIFPKIMPIFVSLNVDLPWTTRALLWLSEFLSVWGVWTALGVIFLAGLFEITRRTYKPLHYGLDWLFTRLPIVGPICQAYNAANFCRTLSLNVKSGVPLSESMHITAEITKNLVYRRAYLDFATYIEKGEKISTAMNKYLKIFPDMLPHLILIGETTGSLSQSLSYLSDLYEAEVDDATKNLSNSIEPILLMVMGLLVGVIAVSIIAPIYEVTKYIGAGR